MCPFWVTNIFPIVSTGMWLNYLWAWILHKMWNSFHFVSYSKMCFICKHITRWFVFNMKKSFFICVVLSVLQETYVSHGLRTLERSAKHETTKAWTDTFDCHRTICSLWRWKGKGWNSSRVSEILQKVKQGCAVSIILDFHAHKVSFSLWISFGDG